jgi:hypothetical protein
MADEPSGNGSEPSGPTELDRFQALAKKLVSVPKAEIDKQRKKIDHARRARTN